MSLDHKAFAFDWGSFEGELLPLLHSSLDSCDSQLLFLFIQEHHDSLVDPYEGHPLEVEWRSRLENGDVQEVADFALTRYYDPTDDQGLGAAWSAISERMPLEARDALLGSPIGPGNELFDPGRMGSYFQTSEQAWQSARILGQIDHPDLQTFQDFLMKCHSMLRGVYVTF